jgi:GT2 family glycosyltransferase
MQRPQISVIIPHFQDLGGLSLCLGALERQTLPAEQFEIIVADNDSPIGRQAVEDVLDGMARLVVVKDRGAGPARNGGVAQSSGKILAFIDSDCVASPQWLAEGIAALDDFDFAGGRVVVSVEREDRLTPTEAFERVFAFDFKDYIERKGFAGSGNLFVGRKVFDHVGGFSNGVSEDVEWSRRAIGHGYRLGYAEKAIVAHPARRNWNELRAKWERINRETYALHRSAKGGRLRWMLRTMLLPASAVAHTPRVLVADALKSPRERVGALGILYRSRLWRFRDALKLAFGR